MPNDRTNSELFKEPSRKKNIDKQLKTEMVKEPIDLDKINTLIDAGADINSVSNHGISLLMVVIAANNNTLFDKLMAKGVNVNPVDNNGFNALITASVVGNEYMVRELLNAGANPLHKNQVRHRMPPVPSLLASEWANSKNNTNIVNILRTAEQAVLNQNYSRHSLLPPIPVQPRPDAKAATQTFNFTSPAPSILQNPQQAVPSTSLNSIIPPFQKPTVSASSPTSPAPNAQNPQSAPQTNPEIDLSLAIKLNKDLNEIKGIIQRGSINITKLNSMSQSYLVEAVQHNRLDVVSYIIGKRVDLDQEHNVYLPGRPAIPLPNQPKITALIEAARRIETAQDLGELKTTCAIINTLIDHGANIYKKDSTNKNMLDYLLPNVVAHPHKIFLIEQLQRKIPKLSTLHQEKVTLKTESEVELSLLEDFNKTMILFMDKINQLKNRNNEQKQDSNTYRSLQEAVITANTLYEQLNHEKSCFIKEINPQSYELFDKNCKEHINTARTVLDKHRGWSEFLVNLVIGVTTLGVGLLIKGAVNLANNKNFLDVHQTDSSKKLNEIEESIQNANPRPGAK